MSSDSSWSSLMRICLIIFRVQIPRALECARGTRWQAVDLPLRGRLPLRGGLPLRGFLFVRGSLLLDGRFGPGRVAALEPEFSRVRLKFEIPLDRFGSQRLPLSVSVGLLPLSVGRQLFSGGGGPRLIQWSLQVGFEGSPGGPGRAGSGVAIHERRSHPPWMGHN